jgi:hypothetical protein
MDENYCPDVLFLRTSARVRVYPADGFLPSTDAVKTASAWTRKRVNASVRTWVPADMDPRALMRPHGRGADAPFLQCGAVRLCLCRAFYSEYSSYHSWANLVHREILHGRQSILSPRSR